MVAPRLRFHQSVFAVFSVQRKRAVNQNTPGFNAEKNTDPLANARHEHHHEHHKQTQQPACENEKVL
jgi:hypothetical protein